MILQNGCLTIGFFLSLSCILIRKSILNWIKKIFWSLPHWIKLLNYSIEFYPIESNYMNYHHVNKMGRKVIINSIQTLIKTIWHLYLFIFWLYTIAASQKQEHLKGRDDQERCFNEELQFKKKNPLLESGQTCTKVDSIGIFIIVFW